MPVAVPLLAGREWRDVEESAEEEEERRAKWHRGDDAPLPSRENLGREAVDDGVCVDEESSSGLRAKRAGGSERTHESRRERDDHATQHDARPARDKDKDERRGRRGQRRVGERLGPSEGRLDEVGAEERAGETRDGVEDVCVVLWLESAMRGERRENGRDAQSRRVSSCVASAEAEPSWASLASRNLGRKTLKICAARQVSLESGESRKGAERQLETHRVPCARERPDGPHEQRRVPPLWLEEVLERSDVLLRAAPPPLRQPLDPRRPLAALTPHTGRHVRRWQREGDEVGFVVLAERRRRGHVVLCLSGRRHFARGVQLRLGDRRVLRRLGRGTRSVDDVAQGKALVVAVDARNAAEDDDGGRRAVGRDEEFGRLVQAEEEHSADKHGDTL